MVVQTTAALRLHHKKQKYKCKTCGRQYIVGVAARRVNTTKK